MRPVLTAGEMRAIDRRAMEEYKIPGLILMEHAAQAVAGAVRERFAPVRTAVFAGTGNNGGDGWAVARLLRAAGWEVTVFHPGQGRDLPPDATANREMALRFGVPDRPWDEVLDGSGLGREYGLVIDALLGTGFRGTVTGDYARLIEAINGSGLPVVAVDIPSGVEADTGRISGPAVRARVTVTFGRPKVGLMLFPGREAAGEVVVDTIGLPGALLAEPSSFYTLEPGDAAALLPPRVPDSHKGTYGRLLVVGGSPGLTGAPVLAGLAALRCGTGLVTLGLREGLALPEKPPELMTAPWPALRWEDFQAVVMGPGLSRAADGQELLWRLLPAEQPKVLDADALNLLAGEEGWWQRLRGPAVLTPHLGEMARLCGVSPETVRADRLDLAREKARQWGVILILKDAVTLVAPPEGPVYINPTGNSGLATGGTGDVLAGVIGGLLAQGLSPEKAAILGVYLHGAAGDLAAAEFGKAGMIAGDLLEKLALVIKRGAECGTI
jgi:NAD(P)H-hydrate epimerase